jgi:hypothetical protein
MMMTVLLAAAQAADHGVVAKADAAYILAAAPLQRLVAMSWRQQKE